MKTEKHPKLANGQPAISCFSLSWIELKRRNDLAHERATEELRKQGADYQDHELPALLMQIAHGILWHTDFPAGLRFMVCDTELFEVTARLLLDLESANGEQPLDFWDYGYVADLLRELLTQQGLPKGDRLCLKRALAWVEEKGGLLRDYALE